MASLKHCATEIRRICNSLVHNSGPGKFILVEGMPGAGKTTLLKALVENGCLHALPQLDHVAAIVRPEQRDWDLSRWYIEAELHRQPHLNELLSVGRSVIQDRGIVSTIAYAYANAQKTRHKHQLEEFLHR